MKKILIQHLVVGFLFILPFQMLSAQNLTVSNMDELKAAVDQLQPGHIIVLEDGQYESKNLLISTKGTAEKPITIQAKNPHKAVLTSEITLQGEYLQLMGVKFEGNGNVVIEGKDCRLSKCIVSDSQSPKWVRVKPGSYNIEIDNNVFENKTNNKVTKNYQLMQVMVLNNNEQHHIHHNVFKDIPEGNGNGFETLQIITQGNPFDPPGGHSNIIVENNLFLRCNGEAEIISVKSNGNLIRNNIFRGCRGSVVLRHGDDNVVNGNFFFGDGEKGSGGVRLQGANQVVSNNYFQDLGQFAVAMMDGTPDNLYVRVENAHILFNTFINCKVLEVGLNHSLHPNGTVPKDCKIVGNVFYKVPTATNGNNLLHLVQNDQPENWQWQDNYTDEMNGFEHIHGLTKENLAFEKSKQDFLIPTAKTPKVYSNIAPEIDLFGNKRRSKTTVGAISFPMRNLKEEYMSENIFGK